MPIKPTSGRLAISFNTRYCIIIFNLYKLVLSVLFILRMCPIWTHYYYVMRIEYFSFSPNWLCGLIPVRKTASSVPTPGSYSSTCTNRLLARFLANASRSSSARSPASAPGRNSRHSMISKVSADVNIGSSDSSSGSVSRSNVSQKLESKLKYHHACIPKGYLPFMFRCHFQQF